MFARMDDDHGHQVAKAFHDLPVKDRFLNAGWQRERIHEL
jgi:hypothetical protein